MGKSLWMKRVDEEYEDNQPGCMWGIFHALHYHHWSSNLKNRLLHKHKFPRKRLNFYNFGEDTKLLDDGTDRVSVDQTTKKSNKRSLRTRLKSLVTEENSKKSNQIQTTKGGVVVPPRSSRLHRTNSIHHLEPSDWVADQNHLDRNASLRQSRERPNLLDIFNVNEELFLNVLFNAKSRLTKSRTFPSRLDHKLNEKFLNGKKAKELVLTSILKKIDKHENDDSHDRAFVRKRMVSLDESLERYGELFGHKFSADKPIQQSKSLKLRNENEFTPISSFKRIQSLSHLNSNFSGTLIMSVSNKSDNQDIEFGEIEDLNEKNLEKIDSNKDLEMLSREQSFFEEQVIIVPDDQIFEGSDCDYSCKKSLFNVDKNIENHNEVMELILDINDESDLNYVKDVLEISGFFKNGFNATWNSFENPLDYSLFEKVESFWHRFDEEDEEGEEEIRSFWHHRLLFDLVNEQLFRLYDRSSSYYPKALSSSCHLRLLPVGPHLFKDVWASIGRCLSVGPDEINSIDCIVARDLADDDWWMNLQLESECVALEVEDLIFDDLIEEVKDLFGLSI